ncbi:MAG: hypothetical protein HWE14_06260 [Flavobacteriia bacterium]|nr:hypothetical protein [Flavobacteriia bacterium]
MSKFIALLLLGCLAVSCTSEYPDLVSPNLHEEYSRVGSLSYFSPSMIMAASKLDSAGTMSSMFVGIHDACMYDIQTERLDSTRQSIPTEIMERIDALELESLLPPVYRGTGSFQLLGNKTEGGLNYILFATQNDEGLHIIEMRGDNLQNKMMSLIRSGLTTGSTNLLPFGK